MGLAVIKVLASKAMEDNQNTIGISLCSEKETSSPMAGEDSEECFVWGKVCSIVIEFV